MMLLRLMLVYGMWLSAGYAMPLVQQGASSFYYAKGAGACALDDAVGDAMVVAMNRKDFKKSALCGAYLRLTGPKGEAVVRVVDVCPGCKAGGLDVNKPAFAKVADLRKGREVLRWEIISAPFSTPVQYFFKKGSSSYWTGIQIRNHRNPVAKLEYLKPDGSWSNIARSPYSYFVQKGMGAGPYTLRVTDYYGNTLIDKEIKLQSGGAVSGAAQFPALNVSAVVNTASAVSSVH